MYVYYLEDPLTHEIKIGKALLPRHRIEALQTGNPRPLIVHGWHQANEKEIHARFGAQRIPTTEWFRPSRELLDHIRSVASLDVQDRHRPDYQKIRQAIIAEPDKSFSWHAGDLGVQATKVRNLFLELVAAGVLDRPIKVRTKDGRVQPSIKPRTRKKAAKKVGDRKDS